MVPRERNELKMVLSGAATSGQVDVQEADMVENVLDLEKTPVRSIMTPLVSVVAIDTDASLINLWKLWQGFQYSRVPVFKGRVDNIVGIAYSKDVLDYIEDVDVLRNLKVSDEMEGPYFVPESMTVWKLLQEFQVRNKHMAVVVNEYGGCAGVVTLEDVVEEVVGEIYDETDSIELDGGLVKQRTPTVWDVESSIELEVLEEALGVEFPEGEYETVAGFVLHVFGCIPREGETVKTTLQAPQCDGEDEEHRREDCARTFRVTVMASDSRQIKSVRFELADGDVGEASPLPPPVTLQIGETGSLTRESLNKIAYDAEHDSLREDFESFVEDSVSSGAYERLDVNAFAERTYKLRDARALLGRGRTGGKQARRAPGKPTGSATATATAMGSSRTFVCC